MTKDQEQHLFRKYNYLKFKASRMRDRRGCRPNLCRLMAIERLHDSAVAVKQELIRADPRLVVSIAKKKCYTRPEWLFDLVSDGSVSLMPAVEKLDFARGFKFSSYGTSAIVKNF